MRNNSEKAANRYSRIIERIFFTHFTKGMREVPFRREEIAEVASELGISLPKNLGDVVYSYRYRALLPETIRAVAPQGEGWIIRADGPSRYRFVAVPAWEINPDVTLVETKVPDSTPGLIAMYALSDEQALLAKLRYNRLIDVFTGITCYSLQSHLRTHVTGMGQVETDEIYIGVDNRGVHYVLPIQAKGGKDKLNIVQIEQDVALCAEKFSGLICLPIGAQFMADDLIALYLFEASETGVGKRIEKHYKLVSPDELSEDDLRLYQQRTSEYFT
jgi:hypothetical protein